MFPNANTVGVPYNNVVGVQVIPAGALCIGVYNAGAADGIVNGGILPAGVSITLAFSGTTYGEITIDGTGTTLHAMAFIYQ